MIRSRRALSASTLLAVLPALAFLPPATAQAPATGGLGTGAPAGAAPGSNAPGANSPAPGVGGGVGTPPPNRPLTLADVVARAVGGNSGLVTARQRLQKAQELIVQVNAQGRPQFRVDGADTYTSYPAFAPTLPNPTITNPTLPGGGQIPVVVDQGNGFSTSFIGGGGGGNAPASGGFAPSTTSLGASPGVGGPVSNPGVGTSPGTGNGPGLGNTTGTPGGTAPGSTPAPGGTGSPGATLPGAGTPGNGGTTVPATPGGANGGTTTPATPGNGAPGSAAPGTGGPAAPGGTNGGPATPGGTGTPGGAPGGATPAPGGTLAPGTGPAPTGTPGGTAGPGQGASFPSILAGYLTDLGSASPKPGEPSKQVASATMPAAHAEEDTPAKPQDTTGGGTTSPVTGGGASGLRGDRNNYAARVSVSQYLDLFGLLPAARDAQKDVRDFYSLDIERLQNETALAAKNLFFNLLLAQEQVTTQDEQVRYAQENVRITEARLRQGIVSRFDVLTAQTALSTAQQQLIAAQDQRDLAQADLSYLLGTDPDQPLALQTPALPPLDQAINLRQTTQVAQDRRPEVKQAAANVSEARRLVKLAGSTLLPTLGLVASGEQASIASATAPRSYASLTAQLAVPLDDGGATRSRVRSARVDVDTQVLTLEQIKLNVSLEVRQATLNIRSAQAQVASAQTGVAQAQEALRLAYLRYQGGLGTFLDVLNALAQLARTRTNLSDADFFYQTSLAQLVRATGGR